MTGEKFNHLAHIITDWGICGTGDLLIGSDAYAKPITALLRINRRANQKEREMEHMEQKMDEQIDGALHEQKERFDKVARAFEVIKKAMVDDNPSQPGSYAHSWHCNIAMSCYDAAMADVKNKPLHYMTDVQWRRIANDAASRFMRLCFGVETRQ